MIYIPKVIKDIVGMLDYRIDGMGMSGSKVLIYEDYVLKIQEHSEETDNENNIIRWLDGAILVPDILAYCVEENIAYTLMSRIKGKMLCDEEYLNNPEKLIDIVADAIKILWQVDVSKCNCNVSRLDERLKKARWNVENELIDLDNVEPETFGAGGFENPEKLLEWLEKNRPKEDIVLTHGDFCLPNIIVKNDVVNGFIDLGKMGPADRWTDLSVAIRSLKHNFEGKYHNGKMFYDFKPEMLLDRLGIEMDEEKRLYYMLLDELF